jgi:hypothetical protein
VQWSKLTFNAIFSQVHSFYSCSFKLMMRNMVAQDDYCCPMIPLKIQAILSDGQSSVTFDRFSDKSPDEAGLPGVTLLDSHSKLNIE